MNNYIPYCFNEFKEYCQNNGIETDIDNNKCVCYLYTNKKNTLPLFL